MYSLFLSTRYGLKEYLSNMDGSRQAAIEKRTVKRIISSVTDMYLIVFLKDSDQFRIDHIAILPGIIGENQLPDGLQNPLP